MTSMAERPDPPVDPLLRILSEIEHQGWSWEIAYHHHQDSGTYSGYIWRNDIAKTEPGAADWVARDYTAMGTSLTDVIGEFVTFVKEHRG